MEQDYKTEGWAAPQIVDAGLADYFTFDDGYGPVHVLPTWMSFGRIRFAHDHTVPRHPSMHQFRAQCCGPPHQQIPVANEKLDQSIPLASGKLVDPQINHDGFGHILPEVDAALPGQQKKTESAEIEEKTNPADIGEKRSDSPPALWNGYIESPGDVVFIAKRRNNHRRKAKEPQEKKKDTS